MSGSSVYLLAAGNGRRAGGPKAWREFQGKALLERQLDFLLKRGEPENIAVTIQDAWKERCRALNPQIRWVAENPGETPLYALQALLREAPFKDWVFLYHVDMPVWEESVFSALEARISIAESAGAEAIVPLFKGRGGHPALLSAPLRSAAAGLDPRSDRLDLWLRSRKVDRIETGREAVVKNLNEWSVTDR